jgi:hypothetical protein
VSDVYVDDRDEVVVVEQGSTLAGGKPFAPEPTATPVDLGSLGRGEQIVSLGASVVRADLGGGAYVRIAGTAPPDRLVELARALVARPGGALTVRS